MLLWASALKNAKRSGDPAAAGPVYVSIAGGWYRLSEFDSALVFLNRAKAVYTTVGDIRTGANALGILASIYKDTGKPELALSTYARATALRQKCGDTRGIAADQNNIGLIARERRDLKRATEAFGIALKLNQRDGRRALAGLNLSNLAALASDAGNFSRADSLYEAALLYLRAAGANVDAAFALHDQARVQIRRGEYALAKSKLEKALAIQRSAHDIAEVISLRTDIAALHTSMGTPDLALIALQDAEHDAIEEEASPEQLAEVAIAKGDLGVQFGSLSSAEDAYRRAELIFKSINDPAGVAKAKYGRASVLFLRNDFPDARGLLDEVLSANMASGDQRASALTMMLIASVELGRSNDADARRQLLLAKKIFQQLGDKVAEAGTSEMLGTVALRADSSTLALKLFRDGMTSLGNLHAADVRSRLHAGLGLAMQARGDHTTAEKEFNAAIAESERSAARLPTIATRYGYLTDKWSAYVNLALSQQARGDLHAAFETSEKLRARQMADILSAAANNSTPIAKAVPGYREIGRRLSSDEVLLEYLLGDSINTVFVITKDTLAAVALPIDRDALRDRVAFARRAMAVAPQPGNRTMWDAPLERLYEDIIEPVEKRGFLNSKHKLIIIPHRELHFLSFAALVSQRDNHRFLVERFDIEYAPSAAIWMRVAERQPPRSSRVLAMAPNVDRLPASLAEVTSIRRIYRQNASIHVGSSASRENLRKELRSAGTLHLATFGFLNRRNPLFSFVSLSRSGVDDGRLTVSEVPTLGLAGHTVVLSACQTAVGWGANGDVPAGDDWIGLMQAFLQGGARNVVASLWPVDDKATSSLMEKFHISRSNSREVSTSLAEAQRALLRNEQTRAPFYWAAFVASGS